jgi:hypothetical protein
MKNLNKAANSDRVVIPGHLYELENFEQKEAPGQVLQFIEKKPTMADPTKFETVSDGTTNEEVIKMLIHRLGCMYEKFPSRETATAITKLDEALMWLEKRTRDRMARGVEGRALA